MKTILITGASTGLGKASALLFASKDWNVIATMRNPAAGAELASIPNITVLPLDVTNSRQIEETIKKATDLYPVDILFNNAGYGLMGPLEGYSDEQITRQMNTNFMGVVRVTKAILPYMRERRSGMIITTTSIGGLITYPLSSLYHATKWALEGWSESMSHELAMHNITIKTVAPGGISTDFIGRSLDLAKHEDYDLLFQKLVSGINDPNGALQFGTPESIASVVFEAATDGKDQLRYVAGEDALAMYAQRLKLGNEVFRQQMSAQFK
ncbi:SDR family oxidoreductase [Flavitalea sp.]|nr:SDR family oxidoreductase [Flavitalea sp.]